jgi:serpin B
MKKPLIPVLVVIYAVIMTGCNTQISPVNTDTISQIELSVLESDTLQSASQMISISELNSKEQQIFSDGNKSFTVDLYQKLKELEGNIFYSPYSISSALALVYAGAENRTKTQMSDTLHFSTDDEGLNRAFNYTNNQLNRKNIIAENDDEDIFQLNISNAVWAQKGMQFRVDYLDALSRYYAAGMRGVDFIDQPDEAVNTINEWISEQTNDRIKDLIKQGDINKLTRLVLTNAIYFNAAWQHKFDENITTESPFYLPDGEQIIVPAMRQTESFKYAKGTNFQAVELPYEGEETSMLILLPNEGKFASFENSFDASLITNITKRLKYRKVTLFMPKFEFGSRFSLSKILAEMGMPDAFSPEADFSGITGKKDLLIQDVIHQSFISVDEYGTEAAAATAVIMAGASPSEPITVNIDRPFIFLIRDIPTDTVLFTGRVYNPELK